MTAPSAVDAALVEWGERLFYPGNRIVRSTGTPRLTALSVGHRAAAVRARLEATVLRCAPQVMVKVTGGGRGMAAIAAHFRYIAKAGRLPFEDDRGVTREGKEALSDLVAGPDVSVAAVAPGVIEVTGLTSEQIGEEAAANAIVLHELTPLQATLEEAFMELTQDAVEFQAGAPTAAAAGQGVPA